jgi:hypothetical protein
MECQEEGCARPLEARGWCHYHYCLWWETHRPARPEKICEICGKTFIPNKGPERTCSMSCGVSLGHRNRKKLPRTPCPICGELTPRPRSMFCSNACKFRSYNKICTVDDCERHSESSQFGMCATHADRFLKDHPVTGLRRSMAEGERRVYANGYVVVKVNGRRIAEHHLVMERILGRPLWPDENVHHKNGIKDDNDPCNLELWATPQPAGQRVEDIVAFYVERYPELAEQALHRMKRKAG